MAKFNLSYDSDTKEYSITRDGIEIENVTSVSFSKYDCEDKPYFSIQSSKKEKGVTECYTVYASLSEVEQASAAIADMFNKR